MSKSLPFFYKKQINEYLVLILVDKCNVNFLPSNVNWPQYQDNSCEQKDPKIPVVFTAYACF